MSTQRNKANTEAVLSDAEISLKWSIEAATIGKMSLRTIAKGFGKGITHGDIQRILKGKFPVSAKKRTILGLPALIPTIACTACGEVHAYDRACQMQVIVKPKPKTPEQPDRLPRFESWLWSISKKKIVMMLENREVIK